MRDAMLIFLVIGLAMGLGSGFANIFIAMASSKMNKEDSVAFQLRTIQSLSKMGHIGLLLLLITGGYLMTPYWSSLTETPTLLVKLILFLILGALIGMISGNARRAQKGDADKYIKKIDTLRKIALGAAVTIIGLAVATFH